jgi:hypothetical protein
MDMQLCGGSGIFDVDYMDLIQINQVNVRDQSLETLNNIFLFLYKHHSKDSILLPCNFG